MKRFILTAVAALALTGCGQALKDANLLLGTNATTPGQLFCEVASASGPIVVTILDAAGVPFVVTGLAQDAVAAACKAWNPSAVPVPPVAVPVPAVSVVVPASK